MGKKGYILSGAALLAALTLLAGCGKNNDTEDKNKDKPDTDPAQEIVLVDVAEIVALAAEARDRYLSFRVEERYAQLCLLRHARHYAEALQCAYALHLGYKRLARRGVEDPVERVFML